jgi:hypothetical protein
MHSRTGRRIYMCKSPPPVGHQDAASNTGVLALSAKAITQWTISRRSNPESNKCVKNWGFSTQLRKMPEGCISTSKVGQQLCLLRIATTQVDNRVDSINRHKVVNNKAGIRDSSREAITKVVISKMARMTSWRSWL